MVIPPFQCFLSRVVCFLKYKYINKKIFTSTICLHISLKQSIPLSLRMVKHICATKHSIFIILTHTLRHLENLSPHMIRSISPAKKAYTLGKMTRAPELVTKSCHNYYPTLAGDFTATTDMSGSTRSSKSYQHCKRQYLVQRLKE